MTKITGCSWAFLEAGADVAFHVLANAALKWPIRSAEAAIYGTFNAISNGVLQGIIGRCCCSKKEEKSGADCYGMDEAFDLMENSAKKVAKTFFAFVPAAAISWGITQTIVESPFSFPDALALSGTALGLKAGMLVTGLVLVGTILYMECLWRERRDASPRRDYSPKPRVQEREEVRASRLCMPCISEKEDPSPRREYRPEPRMQELPPLQQRMVQEREEGEPSPRHWRIDMPQEEGTPNTGAPSAPPLSVP